MGSTGDKRKGESERKLIKYKRVCHRGLEEPRSSSDRNLCTPISYGKWEQMFRWLVVYYKTRGVEKGNNDS